MREILFRAKRTDNGAWETGGLVVVRGGCSDEQVYISEKMTGYHTSVLPETVGQFTGVTDKNGRKIFEGDIVKYTSHETKETYLCTVSYHEACAFFQLNFENKEFASFLYCSGCACEAIGNVFDNPELLKGD